MVVKWALDVLTAVFTWVLSLFDPITLPDWHSAVVSAVHTIDDYLVSVSVWFPYDVTIAVVMVVGGAVFVALGIKVARIAASFLTFGGGSAA